MNWIDSSHSTFIHSHFWTFYLVFSCHPRINNKIGVQTIARFTWVNSVLNDLIWPFYFSSNFNCKFVNSEKAMRILSFFAALPFVIVSCLLLLGTTENGAVIPPSEANNQTGERIFCFNFNNFNFTFYYASVPRN